MSVPPFLASTLVDEFGGSHSESKYGRHMARHLDLGRFG